MSGRGIRGHTPEAEARSVCGPERAKAEALAYLEAENKGKVNDGRRRRSPHLRIEIWGTLTCPQNLIQP